MEKQEIILKISSAITKFLAKDSFLLTVDINERALTHKFAEYLQGEMDTFGSDWNVDCEYNRDYSEIKKINPQLTKIYQNEELSFFDTEAVSIYPDIIIHKRKSNTNLLVIEAKKTPTSKNLIDRDKEKLLLIKKEYKYTYAVLLTFDVLNSSISYDFIG